MQPVFLSLLILALMTGPALAQTNSSASTDSFVGEPAPVLTPAAVSQPRINGARIFGFRSGSPVLYTVAASGEPPMRFSAEGLPFGLQMNPTNGSISGSMRGRGTWMVKVHAENRLGRADQRIRFVCGETIALTPPMGWNSWNCFGAEVSAEKVRAAADALVASGLAGHGWSYINIDDGWAAGRDADGNILPNEKFPDLKGLVDYVHSRGLKIGLYSSPGPRTCAGYTGSYGHEAQDVRRFVDWGFDYLKYDWCSYGRVAAHLTREEQMRPYQLMGKLLENQSRDVFYSICQYGVSNVWEWGASVRGNCWRTTSDITDSWASVSDIGFGQDEHARFAGPGHWNDPDMLVVGLVGWSSTVRPTRLTPTEQYTHVSLWCLLSAPLLIGCDLTRLDPFTLGLLSNDEVLAVDQDSLGHQAMRLWHEGKLEIWVKDLDDGSRALGLFNRGESPAPVKANWTELEMSGSQRVRDLWRQKELGTFADHFETNVAPHGVVLIKATPVAAR